MEWKNPMEELTIKLKLNIILRIGRIKGRVFDGTEKLVFIK